MLATSKSPASTLIRAASERSRSRSKSLGVLMVTGTKLHARGLAREAGET
jgi:hypothetical protein